MIIHNFGLNTPGSPATAGSAGVSFAFDAQLGRSVDEQNFGLLNPLGYGALVIPFTEGSPRFQEETTGNDFFWNKVWTGEKL